MKKNICLLLLILVLYFSGFQKLTALTITSSENVTISAIVPGVPPVVDNHGGAVGMYKTGVRFSGEAYPDGAITILKNGELVTTVKADSAGLFSITLEEKYDSTILYSLYARDVSGNKSLLINYPLVITAGYLTYLSGIRFAPTIVLDKVQVSVGDYLTVGGYALPKKGLQVVITDQNKKTSKTFTLTSPLSGHYNITLPLTDLSRGNYSVCIKYTNDTRKSKLIRFIVGNMNILNTDTFFNISGDCNADGIINSVDFSVLAFWYKKNNPPSCTDINKDHIVDLTDFSILAFYWTN